MTGFDLSTKRAKRSALPGTEELAALIADGATLDDIAAEYGCTAHTVRMHLNRAGFTIAGERMEYVIHAADDLVPRLAFAPQPWADNALCAQTDPESFYPEKGGSTREAKSICRRCTVSAECLTYALDNQERFGIWGGFSERERRKLSKSA